MSTEQIKLNQLLIESANDGNLLKVKELIKEGANIHFFNDFALQCASINGHIETVKYLAEQGANIHADNDQALRWAKSFGYLEVANFLKTKK